MDSFRIVILGTAKAEFQSIPFPFRRLINQAIHKLKTQPVPPAAVSYSGDRFEWVVHGWSVFYVLEEETRTIVITGFLRV